MIAIGLIRELGRLGVIVGRYPGLAIIIGLLLMVPGLVGLVFRFQLDLEMNGGFVPPSAPSHREIADQQSFFGARGLPWYMALFGRTEGNFMDDRTFSEINRLYEQTMSMNLTVDGKEYYRFKDLCHPLCEINEQIRKLMDMSWLATVRYPVSQVLSYDVNIGKHVFNRTVDEKGNLVGAKLLAFYYTSLITDKQSAERLGHFERKVLELVEQHNANNSNRVQFNIHGTTAVGNEIRRGFEDTMKLTVGAISIASAVFLICALVSSWLRSKLTCNRLFVCLLALVLPVLALASGCGLLSLIGIKINMLFIMAPIGTLVFVCHLQNTFHMLKTFDWLETEARRNQYSRGERMGATYEQMSPVNVITNHGLTFGFGAARFFLPESYANYSLGVAFSLLLVWILEMLVLGAVLSFACGTGKAAPTSYYDQLRPEKRSALLYNCAVSCNKYLVRPYSLVLRSIAGRIVGLLVILLFVGFPVHWGIRDLRSSMDFRRFLPVDSSANQGFDIMDTIWKDFHQIVFIINKPSNFSDYGEYMEFRKFISDIEQIPNVLNRSAHMSWLFDYYASELNSNFFSENASLQAPNMSRFHSFITTFPYEAWSNGIHFDYVDTEKKMPKINRMVVMAAFHNINGLEGKRALINACRQVAAKNPQLDISAFDTDSRTVDIMESVMPTLYRWSLILVIAITLIPLITLWNLAASFLCLVGSPFLLATSYAIVALLLRIDLDLLSMPTLITIAALGLHIALHFIGDFLLVWAHEDKTLSTLQNSGVIVTKVTMLAIVVVSPLLAFSSVPLFVQYAQICGVVLAASLLTSFFVLPLIAGFLPTH